MNIKHIPNALSIARILLIMIVLAAAYYSHAKTAVIILIIAMLTDLFDGLIARKYKLITELGAKLDSLADYFIFMSLPLIVWLVKPSIIKPNINVIAALSLFYTLEYFIAYIFQRKIIASHLYSSKLANPLVCSFTIYALLFDFNKIFFSIMYIAVIISIVEDLTIQITCRKTKTNMKSFFYRLTKQKLQNLLIAGIVDGMLIGISSYILITWLARITPDYIAGLIWACAGLTAGISLAGILKTIRH